MHGIVNFLIKSTELNDVIKPWPSSWFVLSCQNTKYGCRNLLLLLFKWGVPLSIGFNHATETLRPSPIDVSQCHKFKFDFRDNKIELLAGLIILIITRESNFHFFFVTTALKIFD